AYEGVKAAQVGRSRALPAPARRSKVLREPALGAGRTRPRLTRLVASISGHASPSPDGSIQLHDHNIMSAELQVHTTDNHCHLYACGCFPGFTRRSEEGKASHGCGRELGNHPLHRTSCIAPGLDGDRPVLLNCIPFATLLEERACRNGTSRK